MDMTRVTHQSLFVLDHHGSYVCILCNTCGHRGIAHKSRFQGLRTTKRLGSDAPLSAFRYRCTKCGEASASLYLFGPGGFQDWVRKDGQPAEQEAKPDDGKRPDWPHLRYKESG